MNQDREPLLPGVRLLDRIMKANPASSISRMDAAALAKAQTTAIPDRGVAAFLLGRAKRGVTITTSDFPASHGARLPLRIYRSRDAATGGPLVLNFHGGGFALGSPRMCDWICGIVATRLAAVVVSVDYRLAPTHRFPAAVEDCYETLTWAAEHAGDLGGDPDRIAVMGDSAGANLATVVAIMSREEGGPRLAHQTLIYPPTDLTENVRQTRSYQDNTRSIVLSNEDMAAFNALYLGEGTDARDWRVSPAYAKDLAGLPPAVVVVAGLDPLHDMGVAYAEALTAAGVPVTLKDYPRMPHGFLSFPRLCRDSGPATAAIVAAQAAALRVAAR
jgi:acetyl esterase/lipase